MVELVHDKRQIYPIHPSMVAPGFTQAMGAEVAAQSYRLADSGDELLGLSSLDGLMIIAGLSVEEDEVV